MNTFDDEKLIAASEHVMYEFWMLYRLHDLILAGSSVGTAKDHEESEPYVATTHTTQSEVHVIDPLGIRIGKSSESRPDRPSESRVVTHNALIEAFALHARVLYDFFYAPP